MHKRIRQFVRAFFANITADDLRYVQTVLTSKELLLFSKMSIIDQRHCLNVAKCATEIAQGEEIDMNLLLRAALLHDCGRRKGDLGLLAKSLAVVLDRVIGRKRLEAVAGCEHIRNSRLSKIMYVYYNHARMGAFMLREHGFGDELAELVEKHHQLLLPTDRLELVCLIKADEMN